MAELAIEEDERKVVGMKRCNCCEAPIPDTAKRLICSPCARSLIIDINTPHLVCKLHGRTVAPAELDVA